MSLSGVKKTGYVVPPNMLGGKIPAETFRGDKRPPDEIFKHGLRPQNPEKNDISIASLKDFTQNNTPGPYVSTSKKEQVANGFARPDGYTYTVVPPKDHSINVNHTLKHSGNPSLLSNEKEIAIVGGVPGSAIKKAVHHPTGDVIRNPGFAGPPSPLPSPPISPTGSSSSWDFDLPSVPTHSVSGKP